MPDPNQWGPRGGRAPGQPPVVYAQVSRLQAVPTSFSDSLFVVIPYDPDHAIEIVNWPVIHGATLPAAGADVALVYDDQHNARVVWWDGAHS